MTLSYKAEKLISGLQIKRLFSSLRYPTSKKKIECLKEEVKQSWKW